MKTLSIIIVSILSLLTVMCAILTKVLSVLTIVGGVCWFLGLFGITGMTVLWLFVGTVVSGLSILILPILIAVIAEFGGNNGADY
jgi:hypothetical protein|nr:MAG TPA: hypothetical protein [Caudoviricetes sp.]